MKQLIQKLSKILLMLVLLISTGYTGMLGDNALDSAIEVGASSDLWTYTAKVNAGSSAVSSDKHITFKLGETVSFVVEYSNNAFKGRGNYWAFGGARDWNQDWSNNISTTKAGRIEVINGLLTVSSKDDGSLSEILTLAK